MRQAIERLIEPSERGDPQSPLRWTCKSLTNLQAQLKQQGHPLSRTKLAKILKELGYSLQGNRKTREGKDHPDRDLQFEHIARRVRAYRHGGRPAISVDTKKKEVLGTKANAGQEYRPKGEPLAVDTHDFPDKKLGKAVPYGVYNIAKNEAIVSIGISHDTAEFAVESIRRWWYELGQLRYAKPHRLLITADSGGSNGHRSRLWKLKLQRLADEIGMKIEVCHYPPGTSKWNKIEHRLFCHITRNWRGVPLETHQVVVNLVSSTRTNQGLEVHCWLDGNLYKAQQLHAVDGVTLSILPGESVGLVGESGCGKSTLIRLIARLIEPTSGKILFNNAYIDQITVGIFSRSPYRADLQMVFQDHTDSLNPRFTAFDTITEPIKQLGPAHTKPKLRQRAAELAQLVGLPTELLSRFPHQLSGGQKARVGIARAIALNPKLLILDEPTSALDVSVQAVILHLLTDLKQQLNMSYLFIS